MASDIHVVPENDLRDHVEIRQCWCRPRVEDVGMSVVVTHHSADGREYFEADHEGDTDVPVG